MDFPLNRSDPLTLHVDMNSSFASVEQQANRLLRGQPLGVAANVSPGGCVISPSIEAKMLGIKTGFRVRDAQEFYSEINIVPSDPDKYFHVHKKFANIFRDYSPDVTALSIDEAVIKLDGTLGLHGKSPEEIGLEIKQRVKEEIGEWLRCNVGIGTNRFLAKTAAALHKPDGLDTITHENLREVLSGLSLTDLCGINTRNERRLHRAGIATPLEFLDADVWTLWKEVFQSVQGYRWYLRLRGYEVDAVNFGRKTYGQTYAIHHFTNDTKELSRLMMKLCEKMGRRLRRADKYARGLHVWLGYRTRKGWHRGRKLGAILYATQDFHKQAMIMLQDRPQDHLVTHIGVTCYDLRPKEDLFPTLFETPEQRRIRAADAQDKCNDFFGEYTVHPASMMGMEKEIIKRVPFHATTDTLSEIYEEGGD